MSEYIIGQWPNVALVPGTHTHAVTGEHVEQPENTRIGCSRVTDGPNDANCGHEPAAVENRPQDGSECDTREKLEEDVRRIAFMFSPDTTPYGNPELELRAEIMDFLNRQAAITKREWLEGKTHIFGMTFEEVRDLQIKVEELTAERDELQAAIDVMNNGQFYSMYKAKCEEYEQLKNRLIYKNEKLKALCEELNAEY